MIRYATTDSPKPIPREPYRRDELADYVDRCVYVHAHTLEQQTKVMAKVERYLDTLPPWVMALLIENQATFEIGTRERTRISRDAHAHAEERIYHISMLSSRIRDMEPLLDHEIGHVIDNILGDFLHKRGDHKASYWSHTDSGWSKAITHDTHIETDRRKGNPNRKLREHLAAEMYKPADYDDETFAELTHYYLRSCRKHDSEAEVDAELNRYFPQLWPIYRDSFMPLALELAGDIYAQRREWQHRATHYRESEMVASLTALVERFGVEPPSSFTLKRLAHAPTRESWLTLFDAARHPLPTDLAEAINTLFARFDSAKEVKTLLRNAPQLRQQARTFVETLEQTVRERGIEGLVDAFNALNGAFDEAAKEAKKGRSR